MAAARVLRVAILAAPPRFGTLIRRCVEQEGAEVVADAARANVCILDLDGVDAHNLLAELRRRHPGKALVVLALQDTGPEGAILLRKPLRPEQLAGALRGLRRQGAVAPPARHAAAAGEGSRASPGDGVERIRFYRPGNHLQGVLAQTFRRAMAMGLTLRIETGWEPIVVFPRERRVWVDADDCRLEAFCRLSLATFAQVAGDQASVRIEPDPDAAVKGPPASSARMDAFLWKVAWWNADGRLPEGFPCHQAVGLKQWPNLTRYRHPPQALRLAALLYRHPMRIEAAARTLKLPVSRVCSFVSAATALGLVDILAPDVIPPPAPVRQEATPKRQGLLQLILNRLGRKGNRA